MSRSYQKLKQKNSELKAEIAVLRHELSTVILRPDSYEALEIKARGLLVVGGAEVAFIPRGEPPYTTKGFIPYLQHPQKHIIIKHHETEI